MNLNEAKQIFTNYIDAFNEITEYEALAEEKFQDFCWSNNYHIPFQQFNNGASKGVMVFDDFVIKIPFNYNDEDNTYYYANFCDLEYENYQLAQKFGVQDFFAEIVPIGATSNGTVIYAQEKIIPVYQYLTHTPYYKNVKGIVTFGTDLTPTFIMSAIYYTTVERIQDLITFLKENDINDLTTNNIGARKDGRPIIFDFSGFDDSGYYKH